MRQYAALAGFLVVVVAALVAFAFVYGSAPLWAREALLGIGFAMFVGDQWRRRLRPRLASYPDGVRRVAVAVALVVAVAVLTGWATGVWAAGGFVAAIGVGGVMRRCRDLA